jgi:four helix bundle protein
MQNQKSKFKTDLKQRAYKYSIKVIGFLDTLPQDMSTNIITNQLLRSATSIGANLVEAKGSSSKKDFTNFFNHALKSANESLYWLGLLRDAKKSTVQSLNIF